MKTKACLLLFLALAALLPAGKALVVQVLRSNLLAKPDFLSASLLAVEKGTKLELLETQGSWCLVRGSGGQKGYIHQTAVAESKVTLGTMVPGKKGASADELALAAKGFNEGNEKKLRGGKDYNFADLEWIMGQNAPLAALAPFVRAGRLK